MFSVFEVRPQVKVYISNRKNGSLYFATELFYINKGRIYKEDYFRLQESKETISFQRASYKLSKYGVHIKGGTEFIIWEILWLDIYAGFGFAYRNNYYTQVITSEINYYEPGAKLTEGAHNEMGKKQIAHLTLGVKIGIFLIDNKETHTD